MKSVFSAGLLAVLFSKTNASSEAHEQIFEVEAGNAADCCFLQTPVHAILAVHDILIAGYYADSAACKARSLSGYWNGTIEYLPTYTETFDVLRENGTAFLVESSKKDTCLAKAKKVNITKDFTGKWNITPDSKHASSASCCYPTHLEIGKETTGVNYTVHGTWASTAACQKANHTGDFKSKHPIQNVNTLRADVHQGRNHSERVSLNVFGKNLRYSQWDQTTHCHGDAVKIA